MPKTLHFNKDYVAPDLMGRGVEFMKATSSTTNRVSEKSLVPLTQAVRKLPVCFLLFVVLKTTKPKINSKAMG